MAEEYIDRVISSSQDTTISTDNFVFDTIGGNRYGVSKVLFGAVGTATYVSAADPLPVTISGVATAALQTTANGILTTMDADTGAIATSVASIDTKTPALGQALAAASVPVVLTAAQISTLTPPAAINGFATETTLGTLSAKFASGTVIGDVNLGATDNAVLDAIAASVAGTLTVGSHAVTNAGTFAVQAAQSGTWNVTNISGTVSLPTGASTAAKQPALGTAGTASADVITVQGIASMTALKVDGSAVTQPVSGSVTANIGTVGTLATAANQTTGNTSLATIAGAVAGTEVQVDIVTMPNVTIAGTVTVGSHAVTNAGTFAVQVDGAALTSLQLLDDSVATVAAATTSKGMAAIGTDGTNARILKTDTDGQLQVDVLSCALPTGAATSAKQDTINAVVVTAEAVVSPDKVMAIGSYNNNNGVYKTLQSDDNGYLVITTANPLGTTASGATAHDVALSDNPVAMGGYASATAPTDVSANGDAVYAWHLRNGAQVVNLAVGGTLVTGSAGLPVDGNIADDAAFTPATTRVLMAGFFADETSTDSVNEGDGGAARMTLDRKVIVTPQPHTQGGLSIFRSLDLDETEEEVKATAGQLYGGFVTNTSTGTRWIKFYNATAANVTVGTTTPVITWGIQGGATDDVAAVLNLGGMGVEFTTAITVAATTGFADADTGAPGANDVIVNLFFK